MSQAPHVPTDETKELAYRLSGLGLPHEQIAYVIGIDDKTLRKYYQTELKKGKAETNMNVAQTLYDKAMEGDIKAAIWWSKAQMGWSEKVGVEHSGSVSIEVVDYGDKDPE